MTTLTESRALLEVREWRKKADERYEAMKHLPFEERQRITRERINEMLRKHGMEELPKPEL